MRFFAIIVFRSFVVSICVRNEHRRRAHKLSSKFFSNAKRQQDILYVFGYKVSEGESGSSGPYYRNRKREKKDFEKVYEYRARSYIFVILHAQFYLLSKMVYFMDGGAAGGL